MVPVALVPLGSHFKGSSAGPRTLLDVCLLCVRTLCVLHMFGIGVHDVCVLCSTKCMYFVFVTCVCLLYAFVRCVS